MVPTCDNKGGRLRWVTVEESQFYLSKHNTPLPADGKICKRCQETIASEMESDQHMDVDPSYEPEVDEESSSEDESKLKSEKEMIEQKLKSNKSKSQNGKLYQLISSSSFHSPHARKAFVKKSRYQALKKSRKSNVKTELSRACAAVLEAIFPNNNDDRKIAWEDLKNSSKVEKMLGGEQILNKMWREIIHAANMCQTRQQRVQLLSNFVLFAKYSEFAKHNVKRKDQGNDPSSAEDNEDSSSDDEATESKQPKEKLPCFNPRITWPLYQDARKHVKRYGRINAPMPRNVVKREKLSPSLVDQIFDFITSEENTQQVAYGVYTLKDQKGDKKLVAKVQRKQSTPRLIKQIQSMFHSEKHPPSESTIRRILKLMKAGKSKDVKGIDGTLEEERKAFKNLHYIMDDLQTILEKNGQLNDSNFDEVKTMLSASENYIKSHFLYNIAKTDKCLNHCINFAVSDAEDENFRSHCNSHNVDQDQDHSAKACSYCNLFPSVLVKMKELVDSMENDLQTVRYQEMHYEIDNAKTAVNAYKKQLMRNFVASSDVEGIFRENKSNVAILTADFAMKVSAYT